MIRGYTDHAANERTFLAWVRTGIAVIAFGFVIEKFNLFLMTIASTLSSNAGQRLLVARASGPFGRYDGLILIGVGLALIIYAALRFIRTAKLIDDPDVHPAGSVRAELLVSAALAVLVAALCIYLVLG
jgi:putative membrane protein